MFVHAERAQLLFDAIKIERHDHLIDLLHDSLRVAVGLQRRTVAVTPTSNSTELHIPALQHISQHIAAAHVG
jgi:hypothetical protein